MTWFALVVGLVGCRTAPAAPPDIVLVVLDTVRADHLSAYGYPRDTTPNLARFAANAVRHDLAWSSAPWTLPSHASMFVGRPPHLHGAQLDADGNPRAYDGRFTTLAEVLSRAGYRTGAIVANTGFLGEKWGLSRGFVDYEVVGTRAQGITSRALAWLAAHDEAPVFLFLNYVDAHRPYHTEVVRPQVVATVDRSMAPLDHLKEVVLPGTTDPPAELVQTVVDQYDTALANLDAGLKPLLERLTNRRPTVVVITSDHGEFLGEHRLAEHPRDVYEPGIRVPLIVSGAFDLEPSEPVFSHDLPRLLLTASGHRELLHHFPERSPPLAELSHDHAHVLARPELRARLSRVRRAWIEPPWKLVVTEGGPRELYHLTRDPRERRNLAAAEPDVTVRLERALAEALAAWRPPTPATPPALTPDERAQLRALGYLE